MDNHKPLYIAGGATQNTARVAQWQTNEPGAVTYAGSIGKDEFGQKVRRPRALPTRAALAASRSRVRTRSSAAAVVCGRRPAACRLRTNITARPASLHCRRSYITLARKLGGDTHTRTSTRPHAHGSLYVTPLPRLNLTHLPRTLSPPRILLSLRAHYQLKDAAAADGLTTLYMENEGVATGTCAVCIDRCVCVCVCIHV